MSRSAATSWLAILGLVCFALGTFGQTGEKPSVSDDANATSTTTANNNIGKEIFDALMGCKVNETHQNARGTVSGLDMMRPKTREYMEELADGKIKSYAPLRHKDFSNGILILVDPANKVPFETNVWATKPTELTPLHSQDVLYEAKVGPLVDKAFATYESWTKPEAGGKVNDKAVEEKTK